MREDALSPASPSYLDVPTGPARRLARHAARVDDVLGIKRAAGVTFNDVCLAAVAGALRELALSRWESPVPLRAMVPVNRRAQDEGGIANRIAFSFVDLPVDAAAPDERLRLVNERTQRLKRSRRAEVAEAALDASALVPAPVKGPLARFAAASRLFNLPVSTIPGPREPITLLSATIEEGYPVGPLSDGHALFVAVLSYQRRRVLRLPRGSRRAAGGRCAARPARARAGGHAPRLARRGDPRAHRAVPGARQLVVGNPPSPSEGGPPPPAART